MLVNHKKYQFSEKDVGKQVTLANSATIKIITVIREAGQLHSVYGNSNEFGLVVWDANGKTDVDGLDIIMLHEDKK